jgi:putative hemolysin
MGLPTAIGSKDGMFFLIDMVVILTLILLNGVFSVSEMAVVSARRTRLAVLDRKGVTGAALALSLSKSPQRFLSTVQVGMTLMSILAGSFGGAQLAGRLAPLLKQLPGLGGLAEGLSQCVVVIAVTFLTLVLGELVPKQLALRRPETFASALAGPIMLIARVSTPFISLLGFSTDLVLKLLGSHRASGPTITEEEVKQVIAEGMEAGVLEVEERHMLERVLRLTDKPVRAIMTPRSELAWIDRSADQSETIAILLAGAHHCFIVCESSVDNPVGVVDAKDLLNQSLKGVQFSIAAAMRQPIVVLDTTPVLDTLDQLKSNALGIALVVDEYGSFEGAVTADDMRDAMFGKTGTSSLPISGSMPMPDISLLLNGLMSIDEVKLRLGLPKLPAEGSYHTLGGLLLALLRRVPSEGDTIVFGTWRLKVASMDGRRVAHVEATRDRSS